VSGRLSLGNGFLAGVIWPNTEIAKSKIEPSSGIVLILKLPGAVLVLDTYGVWVLFSDTAVTLVKLPAPGCMRQVKG
jgi:hypothetical protein